MYKTDEGDEDSGETEDSDTASNSKERELKKGIRSLERLLKEHEQKLADYKKDPWSQDNQGLLENAASEEVREAIIQGRINALEKQIKGIKTRIRQKQEQLLKDE